MQLLRGHLIIAPPILARLQLLFQPLLISVTELGGGGGVGVRETHLVPTYEHSGCDLASGARQTPSLKDFLSSGSGVRASSSNQPLASVRLLRAVHEGNGFYF